MNPTIRRLLTLAVAAVTLLFALVPVANAQEEPECYPPPPGGCEVEPTCADIIAAITDEAVVDETTAALDTNGDGVIDEADLPASCTCAEIVDAIAAGTLDPSALPAGALDNCTCDELVEALVAGTLTIDQVPAGALESCSCEQTQQLVDAGIVDASELPEDCVEVEVQQDAEPEGEAPAPEPEPEAETLAATGTDAIGISLFAGLGLLAGGALVLATRRKES